MSQQQASPWRRVAIAGLLASLTIVGFARDGVEAGAPGAILNQFAKLLINTSFTGPTIIRHIRRS